MDKNAHMAYEVLVRTWRPLAVHELIGAIRELCAANPAPEGLTKALDADPRLFTRDATGRYGLDEFGWRTPGDFCYIYPTWLRARLA